MSQVPPQLSSLASHPITGAGQYFGASPLKDGGFVSAYENPEYGGTIYYQRFAADGTEVGGEIFIATDWNVHVPSVIELENGNIVAVWQNYESGYRKAKYKVFDPSDNLLASGDSSQNASDDHIAARSVDLGDGLFAIDYQVHDDFPSPAIGSKMRVFDYNGSPQADEFPL